MIRPDQLKALRKRQGLSLEQLAEQSRVGKRTIQRIEKGEVGTPRGHTAKQLAKALGVKPAELAEEPSPGGEPVRVQDVLMPGTWLQYELIERRFGVRFREVIEMAPLMFALLAEESLAWRREQLGKLEDALDAASKLADASSLRFASVGIYQAVEELNLDGDANPLPDYLRHLAAEIEDERISVGHDGAIPNVPMYSVYEDDLRRIAGGSERARNALKNGLVTIADIPDELLDEDAPEERAAWIESRASEYYGSL